MNIRCIHGNFGREITKYTLIYAVYIGLAKTIYRVGQNHEYTVYTRQLWQGYH